MSIDCASVRTRPLVFLRKFSSRSCTRRFGPMRMNVIFEAYVIVTATRTRCPRTATDGGGQRFSSHNLLSYSPPISFASPLVSRPVSSATINGQSATLCLRSQQWFSKTDVETAHWKADRRHLVRIHRLPGYMAHSMMSNNQV